MPPPFRTNTLIEEAGSLKANFLVVEARAEQLKAACDLAYRCLHLVGGNRPSMNEVTMELESLRKHDKHPLIHQESYDETGSLIGEREKPDRYTVPLGEYGSSSAGTEEIMLQVENPPSLLQE